MAKGHRTSNRKARKARKTAAMSFRGAGIPISSQAPNIGYNGGVGTAATSNA